MHKLTKITPFIRKEVYRKYKEKNETISFEKIYKKIKPFLKKKGLTLNRNSITSFIAYYMQFIRKTKSYFGKDTLKQGFSLQLSLY